MDYGEIIDSAFRLSWRFKSLWVFGLFAFGISFPSFGWNERLKGLDLSGLTPGTLHGANAETLGPMIIAVVFLIVFVMFVISVLANAISTPALVDAVNRITRGGEYRFKTSLKAGIHYMWRALALMILGILAVVVFMGALFAVGFVAFKINTAIGVLLALVLILLLLVGLFAISTVFNLAFRSIVVRDATVTEALGEGMELLRRHIWPCVVMALIYLGLAIAVGLATVIIGLLIAIPFFALSMMSKVGLITAVLIGFPVFWLVMLPVSGFLGAAFESMYTIFYFRLYEPPSEQWLQQSGATA